MAFAKNFWRSQTRVRLAGFILAGTAPYAYAADDTCPAYPSASVFAYVCSTTSNFGDGVSITVVNGQATASSTGLGGINTAPLGDTAAQAFQNGQFGATGTSGAVATTQSQPVSNAYGSGTEFSSAGIGDEEYATFTVIPFANGNPDVSSQRIKGNVVVPDLHAEAKGSATSPSAGVKGAAEVSATSQGAADFSDVLSISQFQYDTIVNTLLAQNKPVSANGITVALSYEVHASFTASPTDPSSAAGGRAEGSAAISLYNALGSTSEGGDAQLSSGVNTNTLTGEVFTVSGLLSPSNPLTIFVGIGVDGTAVGENGVAASYDANLTDTLQFLGVSFFADAAETIPLPDIQLGSALGLDYIPADAIIGPAQSVPEPGTWALMAIGTGGLASLRLLRKRARPGNTAGATVLLDAPWRTNA